MICICSTEIKRSRLIDLSGYSGDCILALQEWDCVCNYQHFWHVLFFRNPKRLYGPLLQGVWNHSSNNVNLYDERWWDCYHYIYLKFTPALQQQINRMMATKPYRLETALYEVCDVDYILEHCKAKPEPEFFMMDGAEEYEEIISIQEAMEDL